MSEAVAKPSASQQERDKLQASLKAQYARTAVAGAALAKVVQRAGSQADLVLHYAETARAILALEDLCKAAEAAAKDLRTALSNSMNETGCPQVQEADFTVYLQREPAFLEIEDPMRVPRDLWTQPKPEPDRGKIRDAIRSGRDVPGAIMQPRNSSRLVIRGKGK